jgi:hypothetical protein
MFMKTKREVQDLSYVPYKSGKLGRPTTLMFYSVANYEESIRTIAARKSDNTLKAS